MSTGKRGTSLFCAFALTAMLAIVYTVNAKARPADAASAFTQQSEETQSVSGTISSIRGNSFTLTIGSAISQKADRPQETTPKSINFLIDKNTTVDGRMRVGANADVTYRQENGNNIAINVRVGS